MKKLIESTDRLSRALEQLTFEEKVTTVYNPLEYAREPYRIYLERFAASPKRAIFMGMNPGPWGMAQTGVPFGEINAVKEWMGITAPVGLPDAMIEKRPILGFDCTRSEVSGRRVWGLMKKRFVTPENFFADNFVANYCPLIFFDRDTKNLTPDKLLKEDREKLFDLCDAHIIDMIRLLKPSFLIGFGRFAEKRLLAILGKLPDKEQQRITVTRVLHPSPANPHANRGWEEAAEKALIEAGVWN